MLYVHTWLRKERRVCKHYVCVVLAKQKDGYNVGASTCEQRIPKGSSTCEKKDCVNLWNYIQHFKHQHENND